MGVRVGEGEERRSVYRELPKGEKVEESSWVEGEKEDLTGEGGVGQLFVFSFLLSYNHSLETNVSNRSNHHNNTETQLNSVASSTPTSQP